MVERLRPLREDNDPKQRWQMVSLEREVRLNEKARRSGEAAGPIVSRASCLECLTREEVTPRSGGVSKHSASESSARNTGR